MSSPLNEPLHKDRIYCLLWIGFVIGNIKLFEFEKNKRVTVSLYFCAMTLLRTAMIIYLDFVFWKWKVLKE